MSLKMRVRKLFYRFSTMCPNWTWLNYLNSVPFFIAREGRLPMRDDAPGATLNDFFFHRMVRSNWPYLHELCVDKELVKFYVRGACDKVKIPETKGIIRMAGLSFEDFKAQLLAFAGQKVVAKPTHNSGGVIFLSREVTDAQVRELYEIARRNYFYKSREAQYYRAEKKVIIEEDLSDKDGVTPNDYKFFCAKGEVFFCQVDTSRFTDHRRALFSADESFKLLPVTYTYPNPDTPVAKPKDYKLMLEIARELSQNFDFIRVDLYEHPKHGVMFGELTFSPDASRVRFSDPQFGVEMLKRIHAANRKAR